MGDTFYETLLCCRQIVLHYWTNITYTRTTENLFIFTTLAIKGLFSNLNNTKFVISRRHLDCVSCITSNGRIIVNNDFERTWKKAIAVACLKAQCPLYLQGTEKYHKDTVRMVRFFDDIRKLYFQYVALPFNWRERDYNNFRPRICSISVLLNSSNIAISPTYFTAYSTVPS
jgi:hypothetical protein